MDGAVEQTDCKSLQSNRLELASEIYCATANHDVVGFRAALDSGYSPWTLFSKHWIDLHPIEALQSQTRDRHCTSKPVSLLELAVRCNFHQAVEYLTRSTAVPTVPAFYWACRLGLDGIARLLWTVALDEMKHDAVAQYFEAMIKYDQIDLATELIDMNAFDPNRKLMDGSPNSPKTLLHVCVEHDVVQMLSRLLDRGAKTDERDGDGYSPLNLTLFLGHYDCCRCLLRNGANPNCMVYIGGTPINLSIYEMYESYPSEIRQGGGIDSIARLLVRAGLDVTEQRWLLSRDNERASRGAVGVEVHRMLAALCGRPTSLQMICLRFVRRYLSHVGRGTSVLHRIEGLPLPLRLKAELRLED